MKKIYLFAAALFMSVGAIAAPQVVIVGYSSPTINIIDMKTSEVVWQYEMPNNNDWRCNSVVALKDGEHIAFATETSAQVVSLKTKEVVWEYRPTEDKTKVQVHSVALLEDGGFAVFTAKTPLEVIEVSADLKEFKILNLEEVNGGNPLHAHGLFRLSGVAENGDYLIPWYPKECVYRISRTNGGAILDTYPMGDTVFGISDLGNDEFLFGTDDNSSMGLYDAKSKRVTKEVKGFAKDGERAWVQYLGNTKKIGDDKYLVCNWTGHGRKHQESMTDYLPVLFISNDKGEISWDYSKEQSEELKMPSGISGFFYSKKAIVK